MVRKKSLKIKFRHNNKTSKLIIAIAHAMGLEGDLEWRTKLCKAFGVTPNALSNWIARDNPMMEKVYRVIEEYNLPHDIIKSSRYPERAYFSGECMDKWPWLTRMAHLINEAADGDDAELISALRYGLEKAGGTITPETETVQSPHVKSIFKILNEAAKLGGDELVNKALEMLVDQKPKAVSHTTKTKK
jgi:hypothetical protein